MTRYLIDTGHCLNGGDTGSQGCGYREEVLNREVGNLVKSKLEALGHEALMVACDTSTDLNSSLYYRTNKANQLGGYLYVSIHFNCYNTEAHGTELFTYNEERFDEAVRINKEFENLGFFNRGIKDGKGLYVVKNTNMKSLLVECCFIDNPNDMSKYNVDNFANAIVNGLVGEVPKVEAQIPSDFDSNYYLNIYQDVANAVVKGDFKSAEDHYLKCGMYEGRKYKKDKAKYIVTNYLPHQANYSGVDIEGIYHKYFEGIKIYVRGNENGVWVETEYIEDFNILNTVANSLNNDGLFYGVY